MPNSITGLSAYKDNAGGIFKAKGSAVFVAPKTVTVPTAFTQAGTGGAGAPVELAQLPTGFNPIGLINKDDAITRSRDRDTADVMAVGYLNPVRSDTTSDTWSMQFAALEANRYVLEQFHQVDLSGVTPDATTKEIQFVQPMDGVLPQYRWLVINQDGRTAADRKWYGWIFSAGIVSDTDDQTFGGDDDPVMFNMTIQAQTDTTLGWAVKHWMGGPGFGAQLAALGWPTS